jgi:hypothetical protein
MAGHKQRKFSRGGTRPPPENRQTDAAPIRARAPLIEQFYVAVDRQLKSGFGIRSGRKGSARNKEKTSRSTSDRL